jgi:hypothetical protein
MGAMPWVAVSVLCAIGLVLRVSGMSEYWFTPDEALYWAATAAPTLSEAHREILRQAHPPLYCVLLWLLHAGSALVWLRLPSLVGGCALIALCFGCGRRLGGVWTGLLAATGATFAPLAVELSQVMRQYMLQLPLLVGALWALAAYVETGGRRTLVAYTACMLVALFLHFGSLIALGGLGGALFAAAVAGRLPRSRWRGLLLSHALLGAGVLSLYLLYLRRLVGSGMRQQVVQGWLADQFADSWVEAARALLGALSFGTGSRTFSVAFAVLLVLGAFAAARRGRWLLWLPALFTAACAVLFSRLSLYPLGPGRHSVYLLAVTLFPAAYALAVAMERAALPARARAAITAAAAAGLALLSFWQGSHGEYTIPKAQAEEVGRWLRSESQPGGIYLTDLQTYWLLRVLLDLPGRSGRLRPVAVPSLRELQWKGRHFLLPDAWRMPGTRAERGRRGHLANVLAALKTQPAWRAALSAGSVRIVQGGWDGQLAQDLPARLPDGTRVWSDLVGGGGLAAFRIDLPAYGRYLRAGRLSGAPPLPGRP